MFELRINARYDRIDISGRIDVNKTNASKECDICHYRKCLQNSFLVYEQDDAIRRMNNPNLIDKERDLYFVVLIYIKKDESIEKTYYQRNKEVIKK